MTRIIPLMAAFLALSGQALAQDDEKPENRIIFGAGIYGVTDAESLHRYPTYRLEARLAEISVWKLHPWFGIEHARNEIEGVGINSTWAGGGLEADIDLYKDWLVLTLQTGVGYFNAGKDLPRGWQYLPNDGLEFRHQIELSVPFAGDWRVGLGLSHMSNADLQSNNNSINSAVFNLHMPISALTGRKSESAD